jgi:hypothetical protein
MKLEEKCDVFKYCSLRVQNVLSTIFFFQIFFDNTNVVIASFLNIIIHYMLRKIQQKCHYSSLHF